MSDGGQPDQRSPRGRLGARVGIATIAIVTIAAIAVAGAAFAITRYAKGGSGRSGPLKKATVVDTDGATVDGATVDGALHIKANNVRVVNSTVRPSGGTAIQIFDGFRGTMIENTEVFCATPTADGVGFGNYTARNVRVHGCRVGFLHSAGAPATVTDSTFNDRRYVADYAFVEPGRARPASVAGLIPGPVPAPPAAGEPWPGPADTGVPRGTVLAAYTGKLDITEPNTVIDGMEINGCLEIKATNITIKRSKITCKAEGGMIIKVYDELPGGASVTVEDSEIDGQGEGLGIGFGYFTLRRVDLHNVNEGVRVSGHCTIEDSWIHDLVFTDEKDHQDILQTTEGSQMVVRHNTLESFNPTANEPFNAVFMLGSETGPSVSDLLVEGNLMTGGNYTVNFRPDIKAQNIRFRNNVFVRNARYGPVVREDVEGVIWEPTNVWLDSGQPVAQG